MLRALSHHDMDSWPARSELLAWAEHCAVARESFRSMWPTWPWSSRRNELDMAAAALAASAVVQIEVRSEPKKFVATCAWRSGLGLDSCGDLS